MPNNTLSTLGMISQEWLSPDIESFITTIIFYRLPCTRYKYYVLHILFSCFPKETTLVSLYLMPTHSHDLYIWEGLTDTIFWNTLIITKSEEIRVQCSDRSKDIALITEDHIRRREGFLDMMESIVLMMHWMASLS
jgi:hypothetical protein